MVNELDKIFFNPGDIVKVKHEIENAPTMYVIEKVSRSIMSKSGERETIFIGIKCRWFDDNKALQEAIFSTKDLKHV